jgi:IclR family pca regulon transcriptional regulator
MTEKYQVKVIVKGFQLLEHIFLHGGPIGLEELVRATGLKKTTAHRILRTLQPLDIVVKDAESKMYTLGPKLIALGLSALNSFDLHKAAIPLMKKLRDETGETVNLSILSGNDLLIIERFRSNHLYNLNLSAGSRLPIYCTSQGRAILAFLSPQRREEILRSIDMKPYTAKTITDMSLLLGSLDEIRREGYAVNREEFEIGIIAVAGPILNHAGQAAASLNVSFGIIRHPEPEFVDYVAEKVVATCRQLSFALGYVD